MSEEHIEAMTNDALITFVKHEKWGYESRIQELETCREEMMLAAKVMGRWINTHRGEYAERQQRRP